jgi:hypothetical protein
MPAAGSFRAALDNMSISRKLNVVIRPDTGGEYETFVQSLPRPDGRMEAILEFRPVGGGLSLRTGVQTTQRNQEDVEYWAAGLSITHVENAFRTAVRGTTTIRTTREDIALPVEPTPLQSDDRLRHLQPIERHVMSAFRARGIPKFATDEIFDRGPYANADLVRAFEHLEKEDRLIVRYTLNGIDWIQLTPEGASLLGLPRPILDVEPEQAKPQV